MSNSTTKTAAQNRVQSSPARDVAYCGLFVALMFVGAKIHIMLPIGGGVTVSLQILFALLAGFLLGPVQGLIAECVYLLIGLLGVPVFAHGGGLAYLLKPTFGFLLGFAAAAPVAALVLKALRKRNLVNLIIAAVVGMLAYYACGLVYLALMRNLLLSDATPIGFTELMLVWFFSSVVPDTVISVIAAVMAHRLIPVFESIRNQ